VLTHYLLSHVVAVATALATTWMVLRLLSTNRTPQSLMAWVLAMVFLPAAAIPLYFLIGARKFPRKAKRSMLPPSAPTDLPPPGPVARVLARLGAPPARDGHHLEVLGSGELAYAKLVELIAGAEHSIALTLFILGDDATGRSVIDALAARARAGVRVRVVLDSVGSTRSKGRASRLIEAAGGSVRVFMPLVHAPLRGRNNLRCHRKLGVFDGARVFAGGMNVAEEYMGPTPFPGRWRDVALVVTGPVALDATTIFESDWAFCRGPKDDGTPHGPPASELGARAGDGTVQLVPSGPDMEHDTFYDGILTAIFLATERVAIVTPYYVPDDVVQHALVLAARRGVRVELLVPSRSNHSMADFARRSLLRELTAAGAVLQFYPHGMVHAKAMVVDDAFAYLGSPNMDMRSFFLNYEDALCMYSPPEIAQVRAWIDALLAECTTLGPHSPRTYWLFEQIARILAPEL
jgi:cardiolipin synthase A/B